MDSEQAKREVALVKQLLPHVPDHCCSTVKSHRPDPPDVRLGENIGIEVIEFHRQGSGGSQTRIGVERARVTREAQQKYEQTGGVPLSVDVHFADGRVPRAECATLIAAVVSAHARLASPSFFIERDCLPNALVPYVESISLYRYQHASFFEYLSGGAIETSSDEFKALIQKKEEHLDRWPPWATNRWLLIAAVGTVTVDGKQTLVFSTMLPFLSNMQGSEITSRFDRVYLMDVITNKCIVLV